MADTWFHTDWAYRAKITVTNTGAGVTDYYLLVEVDTAALITAGKMRSDCKDILICGQTNGEPLWRYINPDTENTATTNIWVKIPSLPNGDTIIYIYYGFDDAVDEDSPYDPNPYQAPIESHKELEDLDYDDSGHTGFAPASGVYTTVVLTADLDPLVVSTRYIINDAVNICNMVLPATAAVGDMIQIIGLHANGWKVTAAAGDTTVFGNLTTIAGGYIASTHERDCVELICVVADTQWQAINAVGNIDVEIV